MDVLCVLHDSDEYGVCRWPLVDLANSASAPIKLVRELVEKDVLKGADKGAAPYVHTPRHAGQDGEPVVLVEARDGPCWYASRFVRDEWLRERRGAGTRFGDENHPPKATPKPAKAGTERARLRAAVLDKTGGFCSHCKCALDGEWEIDHFIPRAKGGSNLFSNLVPACVPCNQDKSDTMPDDWKPPTRSPTHRVGGRQGDGPSSATTSSPSGSSDTHTAGAALPEVWMLTKPLRDEAIAEFPHWTADTLVAIAKQFTDHHRAAGSLSHDWDASFRKWCRDDLTQRAHPIPKAAASAKTPSNTVPSSDDKATKAWIADHSAPVEQTPEQRAATAERLRLARETLTRQAA